MRRSRAANTQAHGSDGTADLVRERVLIINSLYRRNAPSGENRSFETERDLLRAMGHVVETYVRPDTDVEDGSLLQNAALAGRAMWSQSARREVTAACEAMRPDIVHIHNYYPHLSPSVCSAARDSGAAVVLSICNFRTSCVNGQFFREGRVCELCASKPFAWPGVRNGCYKDSRLASAAVATMNWAHRTMRVVSRCVDVCVAPSAFAATKLIECGFPEEKLHVKPDVVFPDPGLGSGTRRGAIYLGRFSQEKGIKTLLMALDITQRTVTAVGSGPLEHALGESPFVELAGLKSPADVTRLLRGASFLVAPSECFETFGRGVVEAFSCGTPVIASGIGALPEHVRHGETGLLVTPGDAGELASAIEWCFAHPTEMRRMGQNARDLFEARYGPSASYADMQNLYRTAAEKRVAAAISTQA